MIVNFAPKTLKEELDQNIACILDTVAGTVPLDRSFGLETSGVDLPTNILQSQMTNKIISAIQDYEPRVKVEAVTFEAGEEGKDGQVKPIVKYSIVEGVMA